MKKALLALALACSLGTVAWGAPASTAPAPAATNPIKTMWDYQKELGLSDAQVADIKKAIVDLDKQVRTEQERLKPLDARLNEQMAKDASLDDLRTTLQQVAVVQIDIRLADVMTSRKINALLKPEQLQRWRQIQKAAQTTAPAAKP